MAKFPFMQFYPGDYLLATRSLTDTEKAIWVDLLCYMWLKPKERGWFEMLAEDMARMIGRDRLTLEVTLDALKRKEVCDVEDRPNQIIYVKCRRMVRDDSKLKHNRVRQSRHRELSNANSNANSNAGCTEKVTPHKSEVRSHNTDTTYSLEPQNPASKPDATIFEYPTVGSEKQWPLKASKLLEYTSTFPGADVAAECRKARQWVIDNPSRRKTAKGMTAFLFGWLERSQNRGRPAAGNQGENQWLQTKI